MEPLVLPKWKCHKVVGAAAILKVMEVAGGGLHLFLDVKPPAHDPDLRAEAMLAPEIWARYKPVIGDYLVVYEDGYTSISPKKAFEDGYTRISDNG